MRDRTPKMLTFPDLGLTPEVYQSRQILRMSVERHTLSGNSREVNIFLSPGAQESNQNRMPSPQINFPGDQGTRTGGINATENYWNCPTGPGKKGCTTTSGAPWQ